MNTYVYIAKLEEAILDLLDGVKEHEIQETTGLHPDRCKELHELYRAIYHQQWQRGLL